MATSSQKLDSFEAAETIIKEILEAMGTEKNHKSNNASVNKEVNADKLDEDDNYIEEETINIEMEKLQLWLQILRESPSDKQVEKLKEKDDNMETKLKQKEDLIVHLTEEPNEMEAKFKKEMENKVG